MARIWDIEEQDSLDWDVFFKVFSREQVEEARRYGSITWIPNQVRRKVAKEAADVARQSQPTAWLRSGDREKGAAGSLRSFLMGYTRRLDRAPYHCFKAAVEKILAGRPPKEEVQDVIVQESQNDVYESETILDLVAEAFSASDVPRVTQYEVLARIAKGLEDA